MLSGDVEKLKPGKISGRREEGVEHVDDIKLLMPRSLFYYSQAHRCRSTYNEEHIEEGSILIYRCIKFGIMSGVFVYL